MNRPGNKLYQKMVDNNKHKFLSSSKKSGESFVAMEIVNDYRNMDPPGRFLQQNFVTKLWDDVGDKKAREKTSKALMVWTQYEPPPPPEDRFTPTLGQQQKDTSRIPIIKKSRPSPPELNINGTPVTAYEILGISENSTIEQIKEARCVNASEFATSIPTEMIKINKAYKESMTYKTSDAKEELNVCPGVECDGTFEQGWEGVLLPCFNKPRWMRGAGHKPTFDCDGLCQRCFRRKSNVPSVYTKELQLGRRLIYLGYPFIMGSTMVYGSETTSNYRVPEYGTEILCSKIDYHYFYNNNKIIVEQDEYEHTKHSHYSSENELKGLVGREQFAGLRGLIIRNNCREDEFQDPLQVTMIDAIITEYKAAVDGDDPFVQKSIIVFVDYRDGVDYPEHKTKYMSVNVNKHLEAARDFYNKSGEQQVFSVHCRAPKSATDIGEEIPGYLALGLAKIFPWCK